MLYKAAMKCFIPMHWVNEHWVQLFINDQLHSMLIYSIEKTPSSRDHRSPLFLMHPLVLTPSVTIYHHGLTRLIIRSEKSLNTSDGSGSILRSKYIFLQPLKNGKMVQFWFLHCFKVTWGERLVARKKLLFWCLCCLVYIRLHQKDDQRLKTNEIWSGRDKFTWGRRCSRVWSSASSSPSSSQRRRQGWSRCKGWLNVQPLL